MAKLLISVVEMKLVGDWHFLREAKEMVEPIGIEPMTSSLQS